LVDSLCGGQELPRHFKRLLVTVSVGKEELRSSTQPNDNGSADWLWSGEASAIELPSDLSQVPDVFVYLNFVGGSGDGATGDSGVATPFCYARYSAEELFVPVTAEEREAAFEAGAFKRKREAKAHQEANRKKRQEDAARRRKEGGGGGDGKDADGGEGGGAGEEKKEDEQQQQQQEEQEQEQEQSEGAQTPSASAGAAAAFWPEDRWVTLQEDKSLDSLPGRMFPGALLLRLGFTSEEGAFATRERWGRDVSSTKKSLQHAYSHLLLRRLSHYFLAFLVHAFVLHSFIARK
jgi:hypothetical protein